MNIIQYIPYFKNYIRSIFPRVRACAKYLCECKVHVGEAVELCRCCSQIAPSQLAVSSSHDICIAGSGSAPPAENNGTVRVKELRLGLLKCLLALQNPFYTNNLFISSMDLVSCYNSSLTAIHRNRT